MTDKDSLYAVYEQNKGVLTFRKSRRSSDSQACVEVAELPGGGKAVRDSKRADRPALVFDAAEWSAFVAGCADGEFGT